MTTRGRFLLFTHAGAVALMIFSTTPQVPPIVLLRQIERRRKANMVLSNESRNEPEVLVSWRAGGDGALPARQGSKADVEFSARSKTKPLAISEQEALFRDFLRWKKRARCNEAFRQSRPGPPE